MGAVVVAEGADLPDLLDSRSLKVAAVAVDTTNRPVPITIPTMTAVSGGLAPKGQPMMIFRFSDDTGHKCRCPETVD